MKIFKPYQVIIIMLLVPDWLLGMQRVSLNSNEIEASGGSIEPAINTDGRYVVFRSDANNLVANDTNGHRDIFMRDTVSGITTRISIDSNEAQANEGSYNPAISANGRYIVFESYASNLVTDDTNYEKDIFMRDTVLGTTTRISLHSSGAQAHNESYHPAISADGRYVVFASNSMNLVSNDTELYSDIFMHDTSSGITTRISLDSEGNEANNNSYSPAISADGHYVIFQSSASNLVAGDTNNKYDIFMRDTILNTTTRISLSSNNSQADGSSTYSAISADGRYIVFSSSSSNFDVNDTNLCPDIFMRDTVSGTTTRISIDSNGTEANSNSDEPAISADGRYIVFRSTANNLVANDNNNREDIFIHDMHRGTTARVSLDSNGSEANNYSSYRSAISADGLSIVFTSYANNLVANDLNGNWDVFITKNKITTFNPVLIMYLLN